MTNSTQKSQLHGAFVGLGELEMFLEDMACLHFPKDGAPYLLDGNYGIIFAQSCMKEVLATAKLLSALRIANMSISVPFAPSEQSQKELLLQSCALLKKSRVRVKTNIPSYLGFLGEKVIYAPFVSPIPQIQTCPWIAATPI